MSRDIVWSVIALADFAGIVEYVARHNPVAADRIADRIDKVVRELADLAIGRPGRVEGTHEKTVAGLPYIIAYMISIGTPQSETLVVLRIIHGARDWPVDAWPPQD